MGRLLPREGVIDAGRLLPGEGRLLSGTQEGIIEQVRLLPGEGITVEKPRVTGKVHGRASLRQPGRLLIPIYGVLPYSSEADHQK